MHIRLSSNILNHMTDEELQVLNLDATRVKNMDRLDINLRPLDEKSTASLKSTFQRLVDEKVPRVRSHLADIERWEQIVRQGGSGNARGRTLRQFADLLTEYIRTSPGHRIYQRNGSTWLAHYCNYIEYDRERTDRNTGRYHPAAVEIHLLHWSMGLTRGTTIFLHNQDVDGMTIAEALAANDLMVETPALRHDYDEDLAQFTDIYHAVGTQCSATGLGRTLGQSRQHSVQMMTDGLPGLVVVDIPVDGNEASSSESRNAPVRNHFWSNQEPRVSQEMGSEDLTLNEDILDEGSELPEEEPEIPVHPYVAVYHLSHHRRYRINSANLTRYTFDHSIGERLVLPATIKQLVDALVNQGRVEFSDIIQGKGTGACVLLAGPPGVGKTMTAEVYAEQTGRPLLSVQAAQLGVSPDQIEQKLSEVLVRGSRWGAVVLLDEADVYVRERSGNLEQNAIVASFLRVLERNSATIFLTTNRAQEVDDAILSRCIARIDYQMPTCDEQRRIWHILNDLNDSGLTGEDIDRVVCRHPNLSGRDIKQILKMAGLWASNQTEPVTADTVDFAASFSPTRPADHPVPAVSQIAGD